MPRSLWVVFRSGRVSFVSGTVSMGSLLSVSIVMEMACGYGERGPGTAEHQLSTEGGLISIY